LTGLNARFMVLHTYMVISAKLHRRVASEGVTMLLFEYQLFNSKNLLLKSCIGTHLA